MPDKKKQSERYAKFKEQLAINAVRLKGAEDLFLDYYAAYDLLHVNYALEDIDLLKQCAKVMMDAMASEGANHDD